MSLTIQPQTTSQFSPRTAERRVLLLTQAPGGGVGRHFVDLAEGLSAKGVDVTGIYSPRKMDASIGQRLAQTQVPMHPLPMRRGIHPADVATYRQLLRMIRELGPFDLIHGHSSKGGALARLAARRLRLPVVYSPHALITLDPTLSTAKKWFYGTLERLLARRTGAIIAVSPDEADHARAERLGRTTIHVVPNGIAPPHFPPRTQVRQQLGFSDSEIVLGFVGRLANQKAPDLMLDAFALAAREIAALRLVMVGNGPLDAQVAAHVEHLGLQHRVQLLGDTVGVDQMPGFDVFCLSSRYEGMPYVYLEALAAGLPIVSTDVGGARMCVVPEENGTLVPASDTTAFARQLIRVASDSQLRASWSAASRMLSARYTIERMVSDTLNVYDRLW